MIVKLKDVEPEIWTKEMIKELNINQVKFLIGFAETLEKAQFIARMHGSLEAEIYCDNLQMRINDCDFRRWQWIYI